MYTTLRPQFPNTDGAGEKRYVGWHMGGFPDSSWCFYHAFLLACAPGTIISAVTLCDYGGIQFKNQKPRASLTLIIYISVVHIYTTFSLHL